MFGKKNIEKEKIYNDGTVEFTFVSKQKCVVTIKRNRMDVSFFGASNALAKGLSGTKTMNLDYLIGIQFKAPDKITTGYIQFIFNGISSSQGLNNAIKDEDAIVFNQSDLDLAIDLKEYLLDYIFNK
ncbi:MAG: hypothetical protein V8R64_16500 [Thomasclavelia sp.]